MKTNRKLRLLSSTLLVLLSLSIALNLILYNRFRTYYTLLYAASLDPVGLSYFQDFGGQQEISLGKPVVVLLGDSRAAQWPEPHIDRFRILNRGIGNQTSIQVAARFDAHIKPLQPEIVIVQVGINDLKTIPLFPEKKEQIILNCKENIQTIIQKSLEIGSTVVITTIIPPGEIPLYRKLVWSDEITNAVEEVNNYIRQLAQDHIIVFDTANRLADINGQLRPEYSFDELHLNEKGYEILNQDLIPILDSFE